MTTVTVLIGNTDNKLTQQEWAQFYMDVSGAVSREADRVQFSGSSPGFAPWQNACFVAVVERPERLRLALGALAAKWRQDSIAVVCGETEFVRSES